jgi:hypothetical protein
VTGDGGSAGDTGTGQGTGGFVAGFLGGLAGGAITGGSGGGRMAQRGYAQAAILQSRMAARQAQLQQNLGYAAVYSTVPTSQPSQILQTTPVSAKAKKLGEELSRLLQSQRDVRLTKRQQEQIRHKIAVTQAALRHQGQIDPVPQFRYIARYGINNPPIAGATYQG